MTAKKLIGKIHLWLGLASGPLVFIIALTGCIYAFQDEIKSVTQTYRYVTPQQKPTLPPTTIQSIAQKALPGKQVHAVMYQGDKHAAKAIFYADGADYYYQVYIDQYSGQVLKVKDENNDFFRFILNGHYYLWLPQEVGHVVVASATLVFFAMVISGLILWWPRNKAAKKQRFSIKLNAQWRRKNYDLHNVLGFYVLSLALVFAITGLVWGFQWFSNAYFFAISGGKKMVEFKEATSKYIRPVGNDAPAADRLWYKFRDSVGTQGSIEVHMPHDTAAAIEVAINPDPTVYWKTDYRYFDQYSLEEIPVSHVWGRIKDATRAAKLMRMNYDIHVGAVLGLPGKILAFCASLIIASLPVTGFIIWWGRRKKAKKTGKAG